MAISIGQGYVAAATRHFERRLAPARRPLFAAAAIAAFVGLLGAASLGAGVALQAFSLPLVLGGFIVAALAWRKREAWDKDGVSYWDVAGVLMFLGFAAALVGEPSAMIASL